MAMIFLKLNRLDGLPIDGVESIVNLDNIVWIKPAFMSLNRSVVRFVDGSECMIESPFSVVKLAIQECEL